MKYLLLFLLFHFTFAWGNFVQTDNNSPIQNSPTNEVERYGEDGAYLIPANNEHHSGIEIQQKQDSKDKDGYIYMLPYILSFASTIITIVLSVYIKRKSDRISERVNMRDMRLRTSNIVLSKRLDVFPKLHVQTDKLGAAIRYYKKHHNIIELKKGIKNFYTQLADWDAKYCIFAGDPVTKCIGELRRKLEKEDTWIDSNNTENISEEELDWIYKSLEELEKALKKEMAIFFTSFEDEQV